MSLTSLQASIEIAAAPDITLAAFQAIERWSAWYPGVVDAGWVAGEPWAVGAVMEVQVRNSLGLLVKSTAVVLPVDQPEKLCGRDRQIPTAQLCCWENRAPGLVTLCYAWAEATVDGGSRFTLQKFYRGPAVPLLRLLKGRQERMVQQGLQTLRAQITMDNHR